MERDDILCACMGITRGQIEDDIKFNNLMSVDEVGDFNDAGTMCGGCQEIIEEIIKSK